jgi:phosphoribosylanthranilate isomerase
VGVFVREKPEEIAALYRNGVIGMVQLHGGEDGAYIAKLRRLCNAPLIRAVDAVKLTLDWGEDSLPDFGAEYLLLDNGPGGTGERFDWSLLKVLTEKNSESSPPFSIPFFLAGGIGLHNIKEALSRNPYALDISSGAESEGFKNREKMLRLVQLVRKYGRRRTTEG